MNPEILIDHYRNSQNAMRAWRDKAYCPRVPIHRCCNSGAGVAMHAASQRIALVACGVHA